MEDEMRKSIRVLLTLAIIMVLTVGFTIDSFGAYFLNHLGRYQTAFCTYYKLQAGSTYKIWINGAAGMTAYIKYLPTGWYAWCRTTGGGYNSFLFTAKFTGSHKFYVTAGSAGGRFRGDISTVN